MTLEFLVSLKLKLTNIYHYLDKQDIGLVYNRTARKGEAGEIFKIKKFYPLSDLNLPILKHCTLTNKAVGTIWRALSKPPQRRQGPDLCPLWLLFGTPSAIIPKLAFSRAEHSRRYSDVTKYIFDIYFLLTMLLVYWFLFPLRLVWLLVCCLYKEAYLQIFKCVSFWLHGCCGVWEGGPVNQINHTSWVAVVTQTDRPKSVRNCCLIELFCGVVCVVTLPVWHVCWCGGFCHRTGSDLLLFVSTTFRLIARRDSHCEYFMIYIYR